MKNNAFGWLYALLFSLMLVLPVVSPFMNAMGFVRQSSPEYECPPPEPRCDGCMVSLNIDVCPVFKWMDENLPMNTINWLIFIGSGLIVGMICFANSLMDAESRRKNFTPHKDKTG